MTPESFNFDTLVKVWSLRRLEKPRRLLPAALKGARPGGWWADLGCGQGVFTVVLAQLAPKARGVVAVDKDKGALRRLRTNFDQAGRVVMALYLMQADMRGLPFGGKFEGLLAANSMHFLHPIEQAGVLETCRDMLQPGGRLIVVEYNTARGTGAVPHPLPAEGFITMAQQAGFGDVSIAARVPSSYLGEIYAGVASAG